MKKRVIGEMIKHVRHSLNIPSDYPQSELSDRGNVIMIGETLVVKIITPNVGSIPFYNLDSFGEKYHNIDIFYQRVIDSYRLCSILNIGAKFIKDIIMGDTLAIVTEYLPIKLTKEVVTRDADTISAWIKDIHKVGVYHGDLHGENIRLTIDHKLKLVDLEAMFYQDELNEPLIKEWAMLDFDMSVKELIDYEENIGFKILIVKYIITNYPAELEDDFCLGSFKRSINKYLSLDIDKPDADEVKMITLNYN